VIFTHGALLSADQGHCELVEVGPHGVELLTPFQATLDALAPRLAAY